ncbi:MAG: metal-sensing transcriptional repressor [Pseudomonadota bacterium]
MKHASHADVGNRLKRSSGHLQKVIKMLEEERPCAELAQQLHAVERAISAAKKTLIQDHIDHCLSQPPANAQEHASTVADLREITRYL